MPSGDVPPVNLLPQMGRSQFLKTADDGGHSEHRYRMKCPCRTYRSSREALLVTAPAETTGAPERPAWSLQTFQLELMLQFRIQDRGIPTQCPSEE